jgi:hypothetical protein
MALRFPDAAQVTASVLGSDGAWERATAFEVAQAGTYLGFIALDNRARTVDGVSVESTGSGPLLIFDLALVTYG